MQPLAEIPINAYVSWCPSREYGSVMALGGRHMGAAHLDFVCLDMSNSPFMKCTIPLHISLGEATLGCLSWSSPLGDRPHGILATGFHDGTVNLWDPSQILFPEITKRDVEQKRFDESNVPGRLARVQPEPGDALTCMQFNGLRPSLLACGHSSGGLQIINIESVNKPEIYEPGADPGKAHGKSAVTCIAWNQSVQHIAASTCANSSTAIWNLKQRKASIVFRDPAGRSRPGAVAWLPNQATQVIVAYDDDTHPSLQMWDLRNTSFPFKEFQGHACGITDVQFSPEDPSLMLTCGKDNRIITWSVDEIGSANTPTIFSEINFSEWQISARWSPCLPGLIATSSHVGGVLIDSVERRQNIVSRHIPTWQCKPSGGNFGFAGKFVHFGTSLGTQIRMDVIPSADADVILEADKFEKSLKANDDVGYCESKIGETDDMYERLVWRAVEALFFPLESRNMMVLDCLNYDVKNVVQSVENFFKGKPRRLIRLLESGVGDSSKMTNHPVDGVTQHQDYEGVLTKEADANEQGSLTEDQGGVAFHQGSIDAESFFNELGHKNDAASKQVEGGESIAAKRSSDGLDRDTASGRSRDTTSQTLSRSRSDIKQEVASTSKNVTDWESGEDLLIKQSLVIGQRSLAIELCVEAGRWTEALLLAASSADPVLWAATTQLYFASKQQDTFLQTIGCMLSSKWNNVVCLSDLTKWNETLALLASYAPVEMFPALSEELGKRLEKEMFDIRAAVVCYLLAGSFKNASHVWSSLSFTNHRGKSAEKSLQDLVEKLTILKRATRYQEYDQFYNERTSLYAEILANSGRLVAGMKFLCLTGPEGGDEARNLSTILRDRIYFSSPELMQHAGLPPPSVRPFVPVHVVPKPMAIPQQQQPQNMMLHASAYDVNTRGSVSSAQFDMNTGVMSGPASAWGNQHGTIAGGRGAPSSSPYAASTPNGAQHSFPAQNNLDQSNRLMMSQGNTHAVSHPLPGTTGYAQPQRLIGLRLPPPEAQDLRGQDMNGNNTKIAPLSAYPTHNPVSSHPGFSIQAHNIPPAQVGDDRLAAPLGRSFVHNPRSTATTPLAGPSQQSVSLGPHPQRFSRPPQQAFFSSQQPVAASVTQREFSSTSQPLLFPLPSQQGFPSAPQQGFPSAPQQGISSSAQQGFPSAPQQGISAAPQQGFPSAPQQRFSSAPQQGFPSTPQQGFSSTPHRQTFPSLPEQPIYPPGHGLQSFSSEPHKQAFVSESQSVPFNRLDISQASHRKMDSINSMDGNGGPRPPLQSHELEFFSRGASASNTLPKTRSTAPAAGITGIPRGMPVPWPIPTGTQQVVSATQSTAPANQKIHATVNPPQLEDPMSPDDLVLVQRAISETLEVQVQRNPNNTRKVVELQGKLNEMISQLQQGTIERSHQQLIMQFCHALQARDYASATHIQGQLTRLAWTKETRGWLMALKHIISK